MKWRTNWPRSYFPRAVWGGPYASKQETKSEGAIKWAPWLHNPFGLGNPLCFRGGDKIRSGPQMGPVPV